MIKKKSPKTAKPPKAKKKITRIESIITWVGSLPSLVTHTAIFIVFFIAALFGYISWTLMLLVLTTAVSLEAIYLAIFIQLTVNRNTASLREVEEDIDEIQENVEELGEDVDEIQEDIEEISEDVDEDEKRDIVQAATLEQLTNDIRRILAEVESLKKK